jgi:hypothetical protein
MLYKHKAFTLEIQTRKSAFEGFFILFRNDYKRELHSQLEFNAFLLTTKIADGFGSKMAFDFRTWFFF